MAQIINNLIFGGGGGNPIEVLLWTNPNPTEAFRPQSVYLNDDITNYKLIGIMYKGSRSWSGKPTPTVRFTAEDFMNLTNTEDSYFGVMGVLIAGNGQSFIRRFYPRNNSETEIRFENSVNFEGGINNYHCIPLQVIGYK